MLTRLYIDNFKCFVGFEYKPGQRQLILGGNGSGKSSLIDVIQRLRRFLMNGEKADTVFRYADRTRWMSMLPQTFAVEAELEGSSYAYRLQLNPVEDRDKPEVTGETLEFDGKRIFGFATGQVQLYNDDFRKTAAYPFDYSRSALATISPTRENDNKRLMRFKRWIEGVTCFRINPFAMTERAEGEHSAPPAENLSNFAAWHHHFEERNPNEKKRLDKSLQGALDAFKQLEQKHAGQGVSLLKAEFTVGAQTVEIGFDELSDGQRNLISLYAILHFVVAQGGTVVLDEPDNFISLREIQPWLMALDDAIEDHGGQALIISHHPELINQWAPNYGVRFVRDGMGPVRVEKFHGDPDSSLPPAELIARGWDGE